MIVALLLAISLICVNPSSVIALNINDYFSYSYSLELGTTEVQGSEVFYATAQGQATCNNDLPLPVSQASCSGRIIARHGTSGAEVVLNSQYELTISSIPQTQGETTQASVDVPLVFPVNSEPGTYTVIGQLIQVRIQVAIIGWLDVTSMIPLSSRVAGSVTYVPSGAGGAGGGGRIIIIQPDSGLSNFIDDSGTFIQDFSAATEDGKCSIFINENTKGLTKDGQPLGSLSITPMADPPSPPENSSVISLVYEFGPDGTIFTDPVTGEPVTVTICLEYDPTNVPTEGRLTLARWQLNEETGNYEWVELSSAVNQETSTICAEITGFSIYAAMAFTHPAYFTISALRIFPTEVKIGETATISVLVSNTGDLTGTYEVGLKIDDMAMATQRVTLAGGASKTVTFTSTKDVADTYTVTVNSLYRTFKVKAPSTLPTFESSDLTIAPTEVKIGETVTISVLVSNTGDLTGTYEVALKIDDMAMAIGRVTLAGGASQTVTFTSTKDVAGTYAVTVGNLSGTFVVKQLSVAPPPTHQAFRWWFIGSILGAGSIVVTVVVLVLSRRSKSQPLSEVIEPGDSSDKYKH